LKLLSDFIPSGERSRLDFLRPFAFIDRGVARVGLREFARAQQDIDLAARVIPPEGDVHIEGNLVAIRCRLFIALGRFADAAEGTFVTFRNGRPTAPVLAEILTGRALALSCASQHTSALRELEAAERASAKALETQVLAPAVRAICALSQPQGEEFAAAAWYAALRTGNFNSLVSAYRGCPRLLEKVALAAERDRLTTLLLSANDAQLAERFGITLQVPAAHGASMLTPRETEVMNLVASGLSNKEAARALFITEATVKVHLRHVYEKLGVRGRPEAVAKWLTPQ
jgi:ATP/maltotriose-dependent transcriptional regulator MalT